MLLFAMSSWSLEFGDNELIILKGKDKELAPDEGYLYFPFQSNTELDYILLDHVESGKSIKFKKIKSGENHALIKLKAGKYYWKRIRKELGWYVYQTKFKKEDHQFEVKPGVVNYAGNWMYNLQFHSGMRYSSELLNTNKFSYEWLNYQKEFSHLIGSKPLEYTGPVKDLYRNRMNQLAQGMKSELHALDFHGLPKSHFALQFYDASDGIEQQKAEFPHLYDYVRNNDRKAGDMSPDGQLILLSSSVNNEYVIEVLNTHTLVSYVIFREKLHQNTSIRNLNWIDNDSFLYDLDIGSMSSTHVIHLKLDGNKKVTGAKQLEFPMTGYVIDTLEDQENTLLFANFSEKESVINDGRGLYRVDTTSKKTMKKSFWKTMKHTRGFNYVIQWLTDGTGRLRSAIESEYDKKAELVVFHHWFLKESGGEFEWVKINQFTSDDEVPLPKMLSSDGQFFYSFSNQNSDLKEVHKYSTEDYSYLGLFASDPDHDITGLVRDPSTQAVTAYAYISKGEVKLKYLNEDDDRIKWLKEKNPHVKLYVKQHNPETGNMLLFGTTNASKGSWYLYNENNHNISKLMDANEGYEQLPKGDVVVVKVNAEDGVEIEGYLMLPDAQSEQKVPMVVMPHGGPIGVRDFAVNDEMQHFFAAHGLATLKVNYRGSGGYGKAFESLGNGEWGEKIESDIHQVVKYVLDHHPIKRQQVCAFGGSYGGYSAVMLTLLYPDQYQCAVSFAGVYDLPLMFTGITASAYDEYHDIMKKIVGDPKEVHDKLVGKSPFYLAEKLNKPIKFFHGQLDDTVSLEQSLRMMQVMKLLGKEVDLTIFEDEAHNTKFINTGVYMMAESLKFIQAKLNLPSTAKPYVAEQTKDESEVIQFLQDQNDE